MPKGQEAGAGLGRRVLFVDRAGATAIWGVMNPVARALAADGWEVGAVALADRSGRSLPPLDITRQPVHVGRGNAAGMPARLVAAVARLGALVRTFRAERPDVVHVNFAAAAVPAVIAARLAGVPHVVWTHHELAGSLAWHLRLASRLVDPLVDRHTYVSHAVARSFGHSGAPVPLDADATGAAGKHPRHVTIRNGVPIVNPPERRPVEPGHLVAPGRLVGVKRIDTLLHALQRLRAAGTDARVTLAGSGPESDHLRDLVDRLGLTRQVYFAGWLGRDDLEAVMGRAVAAVFPVGQGQEGFGLGVAEAAILGVPVVASDIAAHRETLGTEDDTAFWFPPGDADALRAALNRVLSMPASARVELAQRAHRRVRETSCLERMQAEYRTFYRGLLRASRRRDG
jgi:glycosyltransferase involved in cell wall biosynthesis